jgi:hypothetical protein
LLPGTMHHICDFCIRLGKMVVPSKKHVYKRRVESGIAEKDEIETHYQEWLPS